MRHLQMQPGRKGGLSAGQCQARAKNELEVLSEQLEKLEKQTQYTTDAFWSEGYYGHILASA